MMENKKTEDLDQDIHLADVAEAFSRKALVYDSFGQNHEHLDYMRQKVRSHVLALLHDGDHILELNAGTGADAVFFAQKGYPVHAIDLSPGMVAEIKRKVSQYHLGESLTVQQCSYTELEQVKSGPFQVVFSNMGGVNCTHDLSLITRNLKSLLAPGGIVTWVVMPHICPWELLQVFRGNLKTAKRRLSNSGTLANVEGVHFWTYYYSPGQVMRAFGSDFHPIKLQGLSVFTPTADVKYFSVHHPHFYRFLRALDERLSNLPPFNSLGDFFILSLKYLPLAGG